MVTDEEVKAYLRKLHDTSLFDDLQPEEQNNIIFSAKELLTDYYEENSLTDRIISLQILYMLESENEDFAKLKKHGISSYSVKGVSVSFDDEKTAGTGSVGLISPLVAELMGPKDAGPYKAFGRLI